MAARHRRGTSPDKDRAPGGRVTRRAPSDDHLDGRRLTRSAAPTGVNAARQGSTSATATGPGSGTPELGPSSWPCPSCATARSSPTVRMLTHRRRAEHALVTVAATAITCSRSRRGGLRGSLSSSGSRACRGHRSARWPAASTPRSARSASGRSTPALTHSCGSTPLTVKGQRGRAGGQRPRPGHDRG
jgi:hypothetical protein